ncbi:MAG: hypothetical protein LBL74_07260 [Bacteroidales bacterium]|nr:hypothetical protein [Bacteroidales bacterium]
MTKRFIVLMKCRIPVAIRCSDKMKGCSVKMKGCFILTKQPLVRMKQRFISAILYAMSAKAQNTELKQVPHAPKG